MNSKIACCGCSLALRNGAASFSPRFESEENGDGGQYSSLWRPACIWGSEVKIKKTNQPIVKIATAAMPVEERIGKEKGVDYSGPRMLCSMTVGAKTRCEQGETLTRPQERREQLQSPLNVGG